MAELTRRPGISILREQDVHYQTRFPGFEMGPAMSDSGPSIFGGGWFRNSTAQPWIQDHLYNYDEIVFVKAGELTLESGEHSATAVAGEVLVIDRGTRVTWRGKPNSVGFYIVPRDWRTKV
jgi:ethanolamine utilization protein EutQ (cupin superfamily)